MKKTLILGMTLILLLGCKDANSGKLELEDQDLKPDHTNTTYKTGQGKVVNNDEKGILVKNQNEEIFIPYEVAQKYIKNSESIPKGREISLSYTGESKQGSQLEVNQVDDLIIGNSNLYNSFLNADYESSKEEVLNSFEDKSKILDFQDDFEYFREDTESGYYERIMFDFEPLENGKTYLKSKEQYNLLISNILDSNALYSKLQGLKTLKDLEKIAGDKPIVQKVIWDESGQRIFNEYCYQGLDGNRIRISTDNVGNILEMELLEFEL